MSKVKTTRVRISKELYEEIVRAENCLKQNEIERSTQAFINGNKKYKSEGINFQIASDKIGKYLKSLRDNKTSRGLFKWK